MDSIKKIVYGKKEKNLLFEPTVESAVCYANAGLLEEWVTLYYNVFRDKEKISFDEVICCGVVKIPLRLVQKSCIGKDDSVSTYEIGKVPLIITYQSDRFEICCQSELFDCLVFDKINAYPAVLIVPIAEYKHFERYYGRYFISVS